MANKGDLNRQRIVDAADKLFYARGYNQTSFRDISDITGIPRGNFYYYFKTKDDILDAVVDSRLKYYRDMLAGYEAEVADPRARVMALAGVMQTFEDGVIEVGCPIGTLTSELAKDDPNLQRRSRQVFELLRDWITAQFNMLGLDRSKELALDMLARMQGVSVMACAFKDRDYLRRGLGDLKTWINNLTLS